MAQRPSDGGPTHYKYLDALRGIAAAFVVLFHIGTRVGGPKVATNGYLAVDFFFVLSGVVLTSAYAKRLGQSLSFGAFVRKRLVRLLPMSVVGVLLGTAYLLFRWRILHSASDPLLLILGASVLNLVLLPKLWDAPATHDETFPANGALWSLFFEMAVNLVWAAAFVRASTRTLAIIGGIGLAIFIAAAVRAGSPDVGWNLATLWGGFGRTAYGFTIGIILFRLREHLPESRVAPWIGLLILIAFVFVPVRGLVWPLIGAVIGMPLAVALGFMAGKRTILPKEKLLGDLSYPIYAIHMPLLMIASGMQKKLQHNAPVGDWAPLLLIPILIAAYVALEWYDKPVRRRLDSRRRSNNSDRATSADMEYRT